MTGVQLNTGLEPGETGEGSERPGGNRSGEGASRTLNHPGSYTDGRCRFILRPPCDDIRSFVSSQAGFVGPAASVSDGGTADRLYHI